MVDFDGALALFNLIFSYIFQFLTYVPIFSGPNDSYLSILDLVLYGGIIVVVIRSILALPSAISSNVEREK